MARKGQGLEPRSSVSVPPCPPLQNLLARFWVLGGPLAWAAPLPWARAVCRGHPASLSSQVPFFPVPVAGNHIFSQVTCLPPLIRQMSSVRPGPGPPSPILSSEIIAGCPSTPRSAAEICARHSGRDALRSLQRAAFSVPVCPVRAAFSIPELPVLPPPSQYTQLVLPPHGSGNPLPSSWPLITE